MFKIDSLGATPDNRFTEGDPNIPIAATEVSADWLNMIQDESENLLIAAGITPDKKNNAQVLEALKFLIVAGRQKLAASLPLELATDEATGAITIVIKPGAEGTALSVKNGTVQWVASASAYALCEFYFFRHPTLRPGFQPAQGGIIANAATLYPDAWAYLQTSEGQLLCKTEAEWQAMTRATWATLADGTRVGWDGIGGAPFYAPNSATGELRLPDLRGMYAEAAGFDSLDVGGVHGDYQRRMTGSLFVGRWTGPAYDLAVEGGTGILSHIDNGTASYATTTGSNLGRGLAIDTARGTPTGNKNAPRAFGVLPCVYLGVPR